MDRRIQEALAQFKEAVVVESQVLLLGRHPRHQMLALDHQDGAILKEGSGNNINMDPLVPTALQCISHRDITVATCMDRTLLLKEVLLNAVKEHLQR